MAKFMKALLRDRDNKTNISITKDNSFEYRSTGKALLDLNSSVVNLRHAGNREILVKWYDAYIENPRLAMKWLFFARDIRHGLGEKRIFKVILRDIATKMPGCIRHLIVPEIMGEYGCWKDIFELLDTHLEQEALQCIEKQLMKDIAVIRGSLDEPVSLLAKWMPSINTSSRVSRERAKKIQKYLLLDEKTYRKLLSSIRRHLNVVEKKMSDNEWDTIAYEEVPSIANAKYNKAFLRHDPERRIEYINTTDQTNLAINKYMYNHKDLFEILNSDRYSQIY